MPADPGTAEAALRAAPATVRSGIPAALPAELLERRLPAHLLQVELVIGAVVDLVLEPDVDPALEAQAALGQGGAGRERLEERLVGAAIDHLHRAGVLLGLS